jgi:uncharacterized RDD family membrane protein YckC
MAALVTRHYPPLLVQPIIAATIHWPLAVVVVLILPVLNISVRMSNMSSDFR